ncbi:hypothetical protein [Pseudomonas viridiflava]|uniref:hypothetical protein n=1 Tax=Pseudomonas viridiflava TaxID=33069 RepID=UPI002EC4C49F|nr:hypothetical protein [Pseudomonas viridiflava]
MEWSDHTATGFCSPRRKQGQEFAALSNEAGSVIIEIQEGAKQVVGAVGRFANQLK